MSNFGTPQPLNFSQAVSSGGLTVNSTGVRAKSPTTAISKPSNTIAAPMQAPRDLSGTYANIGGTIYNKNSQTKFSNAQDFFKDSGLSDFKNVKFDTTYTPSGKETIYGQSPAGGQSFGFMDGKKYDANGKPIVATPTAPAAPNSTSNPVGVNGLYTPPNQGTTGVNQGGIIGNLISMGNGASQEYTNAQKFAGSVLEKQNKLGSDYAQATKDIYAGGAGDLSLAGGRAGLLNQLYAAKNAALANEYQGATNLISAANTQQQLRQGATQAAGQLNSPITNPQTQGLVSPSAPLQGQTTSGAQGLNSLVGQRQIPGQTQVEYYNKATGQGFHTPEELAAFVNSQMPNSGATAANVFSMINSGGASSAGPVSQSDPYYQTLSTAAHLLATNQVDAANQVMGSMPPAVKAQVYQMAQAQGYNSNVAAGQAQAQQQNTFQSGTAQQQAAYNNFLNANPQYVKLKQAMNEVDGLGNLAMENALHNQINMFSPTLVNEKVADVRRMLSSAGQATFDSNITRLAIAIQNLYAASGGQTPSSIVDAANHIINPNMQLGALKAQLDAAKAEANVQLGTIANTVAQQYGVIQNGNTGSGGGNSNYNW